ncbi:MAG: RNA methyltransferase [Crocinitomicaceae bacterium]
MTKDEWMLSQFYEHISENKQFLFEKIIQDRTKHITIALENLFQPHNAAAVLRSCDCFGIQDVHIIENDNVYEPNKEIDMGSSKWLDLHKYNELEHNTVAAIQDLKSKGYQVIATTPHTNDCSIEELDITKPTALLFGTESTGLTQTAMDHSDGFVRLPMYGFTESYNISVSVALALFSVTQRIRENSEINWQLSPEEQTAIKLDWVKKVVKHGEKVEKIISSKFPND